MPAQIPSSIAAINQLPAAQRETIFGALVPASLLQRFDILPASFTDEAGRKLLDVVPSAGSAAVEISLHHEHGFEDPLMYLHLADTTNNRIHVLLTVINDPTSPRFDVDRMPDGSPTDFGVFKRNLPAEVAAMEFGLAPGQVRRGLRAFREALEAFERFVSNLGHILYYAEPLSYHNAIVFERYGFAYQQGRRWMESIHARFAAGQPVHDRLDGRTPFRKPEAADSIRGRSWAIHDGVLGEPFTGVHMYKRVGQHAGVETYPQAIW